MGVDTSDLEGLAQSFETASGRVGTEGRKALTKQAEQAEATQKRLVRRRSGELQRAIQIRYDGDGRSVTMYAEIGPVGESRGHGYFIEHGTARHPAFPYIEPASVEADREWPGRVEEMMERVTDDL